MELAARPFYSRAIGVARAILGPKFPNREGCSAMQDLHLIGVEDGALLLTDEEGERYRIAVDDVLQSKVRQAVPDPTAAGRKLSPREIQSHIRAGMSAQDVASITGVSLEYIQRFEGPVLAEREYVVETALSVPVHTAADTNPLETGVTFGTAIRTRLHDLSAINERWASWKEMASGWVIKLSFTANQVDHDARWSFDPKKLSLVPLNNEAVQLSQQGDPAAPMVPRLRAVGADPEPDRSRFDSDAFHVDQALQTTDPLPFTPTTVTDQEPPAHSQTADLLEALRRRRGEREAASYEDELPADDPAGAGFTAQIQLVDLPGFENEPVPTPQRDTGPQSKVGARKGRAAMPSWDEIVFGARPDDEDDPA